MKDTDIRQYIRPAGQEHASAITQIYRLVQIDPDLFLELARLPGDQSVPRQLIKTTGGFISPPDERDMTLTMQHGRVLVFIPDGKVLAYFRIITQADKVHEELCAAFQVDPDVREFRHGSFTHWSGQVEKHTGHLLKQVHWLDRDQAVLAFNAAIAGLENRCSGKLSWGVDLAVHPAYRGAGVPGALVNHMNTGLKPGFQYRVFRIFEIRQINGTDVTVENLRSRNTFATSSARPLAWTEEELVINARVTLRLRWNFWLSHF